MGKYFSNKIAVGFIVVIYGGVFAVFSIVLMSKDIAFKLDYILMTILLECIALGIIRTWINWTVNGKCNLKSLQEYYELSRSNKAKNLLPLLWSYLILGYYERCSKVIEELETLYSKMTDDQKVTFRIYKLNYQIHENGYTSMRTEIEELVHLIETQKNKKESYQIVMFHLYCAEEDWKKAIEILKEIKIVTVLDQVVISFYAGKCYFELKEYQQAFQNLEVTRKLGGNTKYVGLAKDFIDRLPDEVKKEEIQCKRVPYCYRILRKMLLYGFSLCLVAGTGFIMDNHTSHGNSIQEIYAKRNLCAESKVDILYQEKVGDYEMAIINRNKKVAYCLFDKTESQQGDIYEIIFYATVDKYAKEPKEINMFKSKASSDKEEEAYYEKRKIEIKNERLIWDVLGTVYWKNKLFATDDIAYVGISYDPTIVDITLNGQELDITTVNREEEAPFYVWKVKNIDLEGPKDVEYKNTTKSLGN